jgi:hypothetical protein
MRASLGHLRRRTGKGEPCTATWRTRERDKEDCVITAGDSLNNRERRGGVSVQTEACWMSDLNGMQIAINSPPKAGK